MEQQALAGRYALGPRVGAGGMAEVFEAHDTRLERDVAVKLFRAGTADGLERGSAEAKLLAGLDHPGLVRVLDMDGGERGGEHAYLVMELVRGPDLGVLLRERGPLGREDVRVLALDLARTLEYIHGRGIVHRDIKPSNILTYPPEPHGGRFGYLLTDFGIARFFDAGRMTATGQVIGSVSYFSPEQARGNDVGRPSDIYSLGLVLIECLSGEKAFPGTGAESALVRLQRGPSVPHVAGPALSALLMSMTLDTPGDRPNAEALVRALTTMGPQQPDDDVSPAAAPAGIDDTAAAQDPTATATATATAVTAATTATPMTPAGPTEALTVTFLDSQDTVALPASAATTPTTASPAPAGEASRNGTRSDTSSESDPALGAGTAPATARPRRRALPWLIVMVVVLVVGAALWIGAAMTTGPDPEIAPLPAVPGETGQRLEELYESVQP